MNECSKALLRRIHDLRFATRYFVGSGIDIGAGEDSLDEYREFFPLVSRVMDWDIGDGDAQLLDGIAEATFDFVHSSHCLEHMVDPHLAILNWVRVTKPGGHLILTVPDEDLYEQGIFPSKFNPDHKWTFTIYKERSWSDKVVSVFDLVSRLGDLVQVLKIELIDQTYRYRAPLADQTGTPIAESAIEIVLRRRTESERARGGRLPG